MLARTRLFDLLDKPGDSVSCGSRRRPVRVKRRWPSSYLADRGLNTLWYQVDEGDADIAGFFYYMGLAVKKAAPRRKNSLPLFTPEYALGLPVFARRYFEQLCSWMKPPFALVLDNYQMAPAGSPLHEAISDALELMPEGGIAIIISREQPPAAYARLRANQDLALIEWDDLRLDEKEIGELIRFNGRSLPDSAELERLHSLTDGWLTGLLLLLEASRGRELQDDPRDCLPGDRSPQVVFDYFATEILERQDIVTQEFLMQVALLPRMTTGMAYKLTGVQQSEKILNHLHQTRYFIERHAYDDSLYQFHPLFREFLLTRLRHICSDAEHSRLQHRSARVLEEAGQIEAAVHSYLAAGDWTEAARLVPRHAQEFITQGRGETVIHWIRQFPEVVTEDIPWLRFWQGIVQIGTDPQEARKPLEQAYWVFNKVHDLPGMTMTLAKIVETFSYGWYDMFPLDGWIDELEALLAANPDLQAPEFGAQISVAMFVALMYRRPNHPDMERWIQQTREISRHVPNANDRVVIGMQLATYYVLWGRHHDMEILLEELRPLLKDGDVSPLGIIALHALEALYYTRSLVGDGVGTAFAGLEHARQSGVYVMNPILLGIAAISSLNAGELDAARDFLAQSATLFHPARLMDQAQYHWNRGHLAWLQGEIEDAVDHVRQCEALAIQFGSVFHENLIAITAAKILVEAGEYQEAEKIVENTLSAVREINNPALEYECLLVMANIAFVQHDNAAGLEILRDALTVMKRIGAESTIWWNPKWIVPLLAQALDADIEVGFVQSLIRKHRLVPGEQHLDATHWPWPIKIRTFGGFELLLDDTVVHRAARGRKNRWICSRCWWRSADAMSVKTRSPMRCGRTRKATMRAIR